MPVNNKRVRNKLSSSALLTGDENLNKKSHLGSIVDESEVQGNLRKVIENEDDDDDGSVFSDEDGESQTRSR